MSCAMVLSMPPVVGKKRARLCSSESVCTGKLNTRRLEPACQLVECQNGVNYAFVVLRLVFFRNAGTDENSLCVRISALYILAVSLHGGEHVCKKRQLRRKIFLNEQVNRVAAGGDDDISRASLSTICSYSVLTIVAPTAVSSASKKPSFLSASRIAFMPTPS